MKENHLLIVLYIINCFFVFQSLNASAGNSAAISRRRQHNCLPDQSLALLGLKQEFGLFRKLYLLDNTSRPKLEFWNSSSDCCSWDGVKCNLRTGHVVSLDLSYSGMFGNLSSNSSLSRLYHLQKLNLSFNDFGISTIPSRFKELINLRHLDLSSSEFGGRIPSEISWLTKLVTLDLSDNYPFSSSDDIRGMHFTEKDFKALLQNMTSLVELRLNLVSIPPSVPQSLVNLSSLTSLSLKACDLRGDFPSAVFLLPSLEFIYLTANELLNGFLPEFDSNSSLKVLDLTWTNFSSDIPDSIGNFKSLHYLSLESPFGGSIPSSIGNHSQLTYLAFESQYLYGELPSTLGDLVNLNYLFVISCSQLSGELPSSLGKLTHLETLALVDNNFSGFIPPSISNVSHLKRLLLFKNNFGGLFPTSLLKLTDLWDLDLSINQLSGSIPSSLFRMPSLINIVLSWNRFTGSLNFGNISSSPLQVLDLGENKLNGSISASLSIFDHGSNNLTGQFDLSKLNQLSYVNLSHNSLDSIAYQSTSTSQPPVFLPWRNMECLDLRSNMLQGSLPIPPHSTLYYFASRNNLTGTLSQHFCKLAQLKVLDLSDNNLGGFIPQCLGSFSSNLLALNVKKNNFHGFIPRVFTSESSLKSLDLSDNQLRGMLPRSLIKCRQLEVLNVGHNQLNDTFPFWLESLPELQVLVLRSNHFHGPVWYSRKSYSFLKLRMIDISFNKFIGEIPSEYFRNWNGMITHKNENISELEYMGTAYYHDSVTISMKGLYVKLERILSILTTLDFSGNKFTGNIPRSMMDLQSLIVLNLSSNGFTGLIPTSLGYMTELESLDLSSNQLAGKIPEELKRLTFLQYLNLSRNQLSGPIPQGNQLWTFSESSFGGNTGLCGFPLEECKTKIATSPSNNESLESRDQLTLNWKGVVTGYGCGMLAGFVSGYIFLSKRKNYWFMRIFNENASRLRRQPR